MEWFPDPESFVVMANWFYRGYHVCSLCRQRSGEYKVTPCFTTANPESNDMVSFWCDGAIDDSPPTCLYTNRCGNKVMIDLSYSRRCTEAVMKWYIKYKGELPNDDDREHRLKVLSEYVKYYYIPITKSARHR